MIIDHLDEILDLIVSRYQIIGLRSKRLRNVCHIS